jgi:hypothetical protein
MYPLLAGTEMLMTRSPLGIVGMIIAKHPETIDGLGKTIVGSGMNVGNVNATGIGMETRTKLKILGDGEMMERGMREWPQGVSARRRLRRMEMRLVTDVGLSLKTVTVGRNAIIVIAEREQREKMARTEKIDAIVIVRRRKSLHGWTLTFPIHLGFWEVRVARVNSTAFKHGRRVSRNRRKRLRLSLRRRKRKNGRPHPSRFPKNLWMRSRFSVC